MVAVGGREFRRRVFRLFRRRRRHARPGHPRLGKIGPFHQINALKTVVGFGANISAAVMFIIRGSVDWPFAIMMCLGCTIGSAIAPPVTRHIPENIMRAAAVLTGIILAANSAGAPTSRQNRSVL